MFAKSPYYSDLKVPFYNFDLNYQCVVDALNAWLEVPLSLCKGWKPDWAQLFLSSGRPRPGKVNILRLFSTVYSQNEIKGHPQFLKRVASIRPAATRSYTYRIYYQWVPHQRKDIPGDLECRQFLLIVLKYLTESKETWNSSLMTGKSWYLDVVPCSRVQLQWHL